MAQLPDVGLGAIDPEDIPRQIEKIQKQLNEWARLVSNEDRTKLIKDDAGTLRLLSGFQQGAFRNGNVGFKVSQEGHDVLTASDDELIWSTDFNVFKIVKTGILETGGLSVPSGAPGEFLSEIVNVSEPHDLGYIPAIIGYSVTGGGSEYQQLPWTTFSGGGGGTEAFWLRLTLRVDNTDVYATYHCMDYGGGGFTDETGYTIKYYLLQETAN